uniref:tumor necrosis factor receptor superfamily member 23-like isoform X2 n=1 Tax=Jaculus jaculus TaxID=51337 RepID=UPI001E1B4103|nr:tumor necrosis factor receptor superfamily member 23-like isoform X2 [Jaculus jaculus]
MAPFLTSLLLLLTQLQATAATEPLARRTEQRNSDDSCPSNEYWATDRCCKCCPAGEYVQKPCMDHHTTGTCEKCDPGTFMAHSNGLSSCLLCSVCRNDQEMVAECSATSNRMCQCRTGHFYQDSGSYEFCRICTRCPPGVPVLQECNATADTVCSLTGSDQKRLLWILFPLGIGIGIGIIYFRRKIMTWVQDLRTVIRDKLWKSVSRTSDTGATEAAPGIHMEMNSYNPSTPEAEGNRLLSSSQPTLQSETMS